MNLPKYTTSLIDPFHARAEGAQVPDQYSLPTTTNTVQTSFTIRTTGDNQDLDFVVLPSLVTSIVCSKGTDISGTGAIISPGAQGNSDFSIVSFTADGNDVSVANNLLPVDGTSALAMTYQNYRIVSFGIRIFNRSAIQYQQGQVYMAEFPVGSNMLIPTVNTPVSYADFLDYCNCPQLDPNTGFISSAIVVLPGSLDVAASNLTAGLLWTSKIVSPQAFNFKCSYNNIGSGGTIQGWSYGQDEGTVLGGTYTNVAAQQANAAPVGAYCTCLGTLNNAVPPSNTCSVLNMGTSIGNFVGNYNNPWKVGQTYKASATVGGTTVFYGTITISTVAASANSTNLTFTNTWGITGTSVAVSIQIAYQQWPILDLASNSQPVTFIVGANAAGNTLNLVNGTANSVQVPTAVAFIAPDYVSSGGFTGLCCRIAGLPNLDVGTTPASTFEIELTYHLEGMPPIGTSSTNNNNVQFRSAAPKPPVSRELLEGSIEFADRLPVWKPVNILSQI